MRRVKFLLALLVAFILMLCFRAVVFTVCTIEGEGLSPLLCQGDRVLVNRWSYGLRVGSNDGLFSYHRLGRRQLKRGDLVAFNNPRNDDEVLICRCLALPGDTIRPDGQSIIVPGLINCAASDTYWMEAIGQENPLDSHTLGFIPEQLIIGRVTMILFSHDSQQPLWRGWHGERTLYSL